MVYHYRGGTDLVVSTRQTGVPKGAGQAGYLWDAEVGGNRYGADAVFDDNGGTGGQVLTNANGRLSFTMDETLGATRCWIDLGANERWLLRSWEDYGPPGPQGPPGSLAGIPPTNGTVLAYVNGAWAAKNPAVDLGLGTAADVAVANQNAAAAQETAQQALAAAGSGAAIPNGGETKAALVKASATNGDVVWLKLTAADVGAAPASHTHTAGQVTGLATVATSGAYTDLTGRPPASIPASAKSVPGGVAALDADGDVVNASGTKVTGSGSGSSTVDGITDATTVGKAVLKAADAAAARAVLSVRDAAQPIDAGDTIGFATVATTGSYSDLTDQPPIVMQTVKRVNGTWEERDPAALAAHFYGKVAPTVGGTGMAERDLFTLTPEDFTS